MKADDEIRVNLVLTRQRDKELFEFLSGLLDGVSDAHRAELVRRQMAIWMELSKRRNDVAHVLTSSQAEPGRATNIATAAQEAVPPATQPPAAAQAPRESEFRGYDKSQLDGIEMDLDFSMSST